jgi:Uncharacterized protein involved in outer membrane biogenesis
VVSGQGTVTLNVNGSGRTVGAIKRSLDGQVAMKLANGAVKGFNLGDILRKAQTLLSAAQNGGQAASSGTASTDKQTDFTAMSVSGVIQNGILTSNDLQAASPLLRITGAGTVDIPKMTVDYVVKPMVVNTATGQGGKSLDQLRGIEIPVRVSGSLSHPSYKLDVAEALKQKVRQELDKHKQKIEQKIQDKLKGLFGGG